MGISSEYFFRESFKEELPFMFTRNLNESLFLYEPPRLFFLLSRGYYNSIVKIFWSLFVFRKLFIKHFDGNLIHRWVRYFFGCVELRGSLVSYIFPINGFTLFSYYKAFLYLNSSLSSNNNTPVIY